VIPSAGYTEVMQSTIGMSCICYAEGMLAGGMLAESMLLEMILDVPEE
jgi:hypothetical protein